MLALKKTLTIIALTASLLVVSPAAHAQAQGGWIASIWDRVVSAIESVGNWIQEQFKPRPGTRPGGHARVPELDPGSAGSAAVLLLGGVAYIASRRRKRDGGESR